MTEVKKRNELSIFEELRLKPDDVSDKPPKKNKLLEIEDIYFYYNGKLKKNTYWILTDSGWKQVNEFKVGLDGDDEDYQFNVPKESSLKKYKTDVKVHIEEKGKDIDYVTWWVEDKNGELIQVNTTKKGEGGIEFKIKSWLRNKAIDVVGLEIRSMKKKAHEYSKDELMCMIEIEENKMIEKGGWKALRMAAYSALGLPFLGFM
tara:strand:+ start:393 stop:1004 length:612 start_codon:yes stop_codon:yes gene_type:complete